MSGDILVFVVTGPGLTAPGPVALPTNARIGRDPDSDLVLEDPRVSKRHARVEEREGVAVLVDEGSFNGIRVEGVKVQARPLAEPVRISLGDCVVDFVGRYSSTPTILRVELPGEEAVRRVLHLPCNVGMDDGGSVTHDLHAVAFERSVLLADQGGLFALTLDGRGGLQERRPTEEGWLDLGDVRLREVGMRDFSVLPTDLVFDDDALRPRFSVSDFDDSFPPPCFEADQVDIDALRATGLAVNEARYLALGGGVGSFCFVDALRVHGVPSSDIRVIGFEGVPYARYKRLCEHSQIPAHERLRSNSESCPDNLWGFPGYGLRESARLLGRLRFAAAGRILWQLTAEPDLAFTYTPRAGDVFASIDREAQRIGWSRMAHTGRIRAIRPTTDGRYVVAVSSRADPDAPAALYVGQILHLALGYPGVQFLPDLRAYRERTRDLEHVVNAYEDHDGVYQALENHGGTVILRGRGIVASRVLQRLAEVRRRNAEVRIVHLMRTPRTRGSRAGRARRRVEHHWEFQPFNWPEAAWGGDLQRKLAHARPDRRDSLLKAWGGTTTAGRPDWRRIVDRGVAAGWYRIVFGTLGEIERRQGGVSVQVVGAGEHHALSAEYIIDATGLISSVQANPVLAELIERYKLPLNVAGGLEVSRSFEIEALRNASGRAFASGVSTLGGPYAPVDSFLGLQFAALASIGALPQVRPLGPARSVGQWLRWVAGGAP